MNMVAVSQAAVSARLSSRIFDIAAVSSIGLKVVLIGHMLKQFDIGLVGHVARQRPAAPGLGGRIFGHILW
jgi:hypothetical protein